MKPFVPHPWQDIAIDHMIQHPFCALWMDMGMGKSASVIRALQKLNYVRDVFPALITAPLRVAETTWKEDLAKWKEFSSLRISTVVGDESERLAALKKDAHFYSINYENVQWLIELYGKKFPFKTIIIDESTKVKSTRKKQGSKIGGALYKASLFPLVQQIVQLTGLCAPNGLKDLYGQILFLDDGERLGQSFDAFQKRWFMPSWDNEYDIEPLPHAQREIEEKLKDICLSINAEDWFDVKKPIEIPVYVDLPPDAWKIYKDMERNMFAVIEQEGVETFNAAGKRNKCIAEGTPVLTKRGLIPIEKVSNRDLVWDGIEWVSVYKSLCNGYKDVVNCLGVEMTPDHKVLTEQGWQTAEDINGRRKSSNRFDRYEVRLPDGHKKSREYQGQKFKYSQSYMVCSLYLWEKIYSYWTEFKKSEKREKEILRMPTQGNDSRCAGHTRNDKSSRMDIVDEYEKSLFKSQRQGLEELRRTRNKDLQKMAKIFQQFLERYGKNLERRFDYRSKKQQWKLYEEQLPVDKFESASQQSQVFGLYTDFKRKNDCRTGCRNIRYKSDNFISESKKRMDWGKVVRETKKKKVYDLVNCGPRNRFVVLGDEGYLVVHNCMQVSDGLIFATDGKSWKQVHTEKIKALESIIEESAGMPLLTAYHFKPSLEMLKKAFPKAADISKKDGLEKFKEGKLSAGFAHPGSMGHGIDGLQYVTNRMCYYSHNDNYDNHKQIFGRIGPVRQMQAGLNRPVFVYDIIARNTVEEYAVLPNLRDKGTLNDLLRRAMKRIKR